MRTIIALVLTVLSYVFIVGIIIKRFKRQRAQQEAFESYQRYYQQQSDNHQQSSNSSSSSSYTRVTSWDQAAQAFNVSKNELMRMSKDQIKKMYRKLAMVHHPDKGGNAEDFNNLNEAYEFAYAA